MTVVLQPMTAERFTSWNEHLVAAYAQDKVDAGNWPHEGALERSAQENAERLPQGPDTPGHDLFSAMVDGREVGVIWLFTDPGAATPETVIYDIEIEPAERGRGYGRELLAAAEGWCADHSIATLRLHVFGHNTVALALYESSGFEATNISMAKQIR